MSDDDLLGNIDDVSKSLDKIEARIKSIDSHMKSIGKNSGAASQNLSKAAGGSFTGSPIGGSGKSNGSGTPLFSSLGNLMSPPPPIGGGGGGGGGGGDTPQSPIQRFAANHPMWYAGGQAVLAAGATAWNIIPGVDSVRDQRQSMFGATLGMGSVMPNYGVMKTNMMDAFGGYASSYGSQERVASTMASFGASMRSGAYADSANITSAMREISAMSLLTGRSNEEMEAARRSLSTGSRANRLFMYGISTTNEDGTSRDFGSVVKQVMDRSMRGEYSIDDVEKGLSAGGILRQNFATMLGEENVDLAARYAQTIAANNIQDGVLSPELMEEIGLTDPLRNPMAKEMQATGTRSETISDYSDAVLKGWSKAVDAAQAVERVMQGLSGFLGPMAGLKGFNQGLTGNIATASVLGGLGMFGGALAANGGLGTYGPIAGGAAGRMGGAMGTGIGSTVGSAIGSIGAKRLLGGGAVGLAGMAATDFAMSKLGSDENSSQGHRVMSSLGKLLGNTASGALGGAIIGGGAGALIGGGIGLVSGIYGLATQGWDYGAKTNTASNKLFGGEGHGSGSNEKREEGGGNAPSRGGYRKYGGPSVAAAVSYAREKHRTGEARWKSLCQRFAANCYGLPNGHYASAAAAWRSIPDEHKSPGERNAPAGALYYWTGGGHGYGHVALSLGDGTMACNDAQGKIWIAPNAEMFRYYGRQKFEGWAQPYFGKLVANVGDATGVPADGSVDVDGGGQPSGARSSNTSSGAQGMTSVGVEPWGKGMVSASPYGGIAASQYSISEGVASTISDYMAGGGNMSGGNMMTDYQQSTVDGADEHFGMAERGPNHDSGGFDVTSAPGKGKGVQRWEGVAVNAMRAAGLDMKWLPLLMQRMHQESSGNPNAVNRWDKNATERGTPSKGLMQVIKPTFDAYAGPYKDRGQMDPFANIYAAIKYSLDRYGEDGLEKAWTGTQGYSEGSWRIAKDEINKIHQGEMVIPAATAEIVRTNVQKARAGQSPTGTGGTLKVELTVNNTGHPYVDAQPLAQEILRIIEETNQNETIGAS